MTEEKTKPIDSNELNEMAARVCGFLEGRKHTKTRLMAGRAAVTALGRLAAILSMEELRRRVTAIPQDPQATLPFDAPPSSATEEKTASPKSKSNGTKDKAAADA